MQAYISTAGGYVSNPDATSNCQFCSTRTTDEFLGGNFNIEYSTHWWHLGVFCAFILFNVSSSTSCSDRDDDFLFARSSPFTA
jgi:ATP-binding cassette subfamily G (WHITE) protein 2 (SNQ2)